MKNVNRLLVILLLFSGKVWSQEFIKQNIRGQVVDAESKFPLEGSTVRLYAANQDFITGVVSNEKGEFVIPDIPLGRYKIEIRYVGYQTKTLSNLQLQSAKELILNVSLEELSSELGDVVITTKTNPSDAKNEMAVVSARTFSIEETDRFAGSRGDPSRMASNFAGVQGANDARNDIVIRGNSPAGVLWRVEGVDIPNPNHFSIPGTSGGPVNIINNRMLANSDFFTGAFPAEFSNATAGVFDIKLRNGNTQKYENSFQFGFMGTELFSEGPINKKKGSSYLVGYRYSSLALFSALNFDIGTSAVPFYQDGSFKLNFPLKNNANLSVWGFGGFSSIDILISEQDPEERNIYGENDRDQYFTSMMGVMGMTYTKSINNSSLFKLTYSVSNQSVRANHEYLTFTTNRDTLLQKERMLQYLFSTSTNNAHAFYNKKINKSLSMRVGVMADVYHFRFEDSNRRVIVPSPGAQPELGNWNVRWNANESALLGRAYIQAKYKFKAKTTINMGWNAQYFTLNNSYSVIEPRLGIRHELTNKQSLNFGFGVHSQTQSPYLYFYQLPGNSAAHNRMMGMTKSTHYVLAYQAAIKKNMSLKVEVYAQYLSNIPVRDTASSFSLINTGAGFTRFFPGNLVNAGIARNHGIELTLERHFASKYYFLLTASLFDAKYQGSDGVWRNTDFNGQYAWNMLFTREFKVNKNSEIQTGAKMTSVGGRYYSPANDSLSNLNSELIEEDSKKNTLQTPAYFRFDLRVSYRWNRPKVSHEFALDIINLFNNQNVLGLTYAPDAGLASNIRFEYQLSRLPLFYYKIDF